MFPTYKSGGALYTVTLTNRGDQAVHGIVLEGRHENDWSIYYYPRCINADADADGWNDSLEHTMAALLYPVGYIDGEYQPFKLWGSNYLRAEASSPASNDEIDSLPPDLNDDGLVDPADLVLFDDWLGEGNGIALQSISPNSGPDGYYPNSRPWRRFDLDADGHVGPEDRDILLQAIAQGPFGGVDEIDPTARVLLPIESASVPRGQPYRIEAHAWDNASLARVDYVVDGKVVCSVNDPVPDWGFDSPMYSCWWSVPRRSKAYQIQVIAVDAAGNRGYSPLRMITAH
jgi:hypothetical protein